MFPNARVEKYYRLCEELLNFVGLSWWIIDLDDDPNLFYCNPTMRETFSLDPNRVQHFVNKSCPIAGDYNRNVAIKSCSKAKLIFNEYAQLRCGCVSEYCNRFPYYNELRDETLFFISRATALKSDESGRASLLLGLIEPEEMSFELYQQAKIDSLTNLYNRREFDSQLAFLLNLANRERRHISLIMCDVDHFKLYNDQLGHYQGDICLQKIAQILSQCCERSSDVVFRYGGEEFAIICYGDGADAAHLAEDIRLKVEAESIPHPAFNGSPVTISVGYVSVIPNVKVTTTRWLIEHADGALYKAKSNGRNLTLPCC